jgi:hypothetical protein
MRDGYPRAIPDRGTYWHLGKEVKRPITGGVRPNEHPEINKPKPRPRKSKGDLAVLRDKQEVAAKERRVRRNSGLPDIIDNTRRYVSDD